jgi:CubicO group peptidase (beta-lactamase class C family)
MKFFLFLLLGLSIIGCSPKEYKQTDDSAAIFDSVFQSHADTAKFNGNVLIAKNGKIIYQKSFGYANYDTKELLNDSSLFELASVTKEFTAMGIMMLKEQGKLNYDDDVRKYIPELPYEGMTIRHFLTHTSGIPYYEDEKFFEGWDRKKTVYNDDVIRQFAKVKPPVLFKPGEKWEYSNSAYALLATIIERVSGKTYGEFLKENIFIPLGMDRSRVYNTRRSKGEIIPNYAFGFVYSDSLKKFMLPDSLKEYYYVITLDGIQGDGVVNSTTGDLFKWDQALYTEKLVKKSTLDEAFTPVKLNNDSTYQYGFGWFIAQDSTLGKVVQHSGGWPGYGTYIKRFIDHNNCVIVLTNNGGYGRKSILAEVTKRLASARVDGK